MHTAVSAKRNHTIEPLMCYINGSWLRRNTVKIGWWTVCYISKNIVCMAFMLLYLLQRIQPDNTGEGELGPCKDHCPRPKGFRRRPQVHGEQ